MSRNSTHNSTNLTRSWNSSKPCSYFYEDLEEDSVPPGLLFTHMGLCVVSVMVSMVNLVVLTRPHMRSSSLNILLAAMETSNLLVAASYIPVATMIFVYSSGFYQSQAVYAMIALQIVSWTGIAFTIWMTGIIGFFRFIAVTWPLKAHVYLTRVRASLVIACLAILCLCTITGDFFYTVKLVAEHYVLCYMDIPDMRIETTSYHLESTDPKSWLSESIVIVFALFVVPSAFCVAVTLGLLCKIRSSLAERKEIRAKQADDNSVRTTAILTVMLLAYLISNVAPHLSTFVHWHGKDLDFPVPWDYVLEEFMLGLIINALSFWGYYYMGTNFRKTFKSVFCGARYSSIRRNQHEFHTQNSMM